MGSRVPEVLAALVDLASAPGAFPGVHVADGPELTGSQDTDWLIIGFAGDPEGDYEAAQSSGGWSDLGTGREETWAVTVAVVIARAADQIRQARVRAYEIGAAVETLLRANPSLGLSELEAAIDTTALAQEQTTDGIRVRLLLTIGGRGFT